MKTSRNYIERAGRYLAAGALAFALNLSTPVSAYDSFDTSVSENAPRSDGTAMDLGTLVGLGSLAILAGSIGLRFIRKPQETDDSSSEEFSLL